MTQTFANLERLCASKNVCCERRGRAIHITIPSGAVSAECATVAEAFDTMTGDSTFSDLPNIAAESYRYLFFDRNRCIGQVDAETLTNALELKDWGDFGTKAQPVIRNELFNMAVVNVGNSTIGVTWTKIPTPPEKLNLEDLDPGGAHIIVDLHGGRVTVYHASNREVLVQSRPVARGFLDKQLWPLLKGGTQ